MNGYFERSLGVADCFSQSRAGRLASRILENPDSSEFQSLLIHSLSRKVYGLGGFSDGPEERHAIMKISPGEYSIFSDMYEVFFFSECEKEQIAVPEFAFVAANGKNTAIVSGDISQGTFSVTDLQNDSKLSFALEPDYLQAKERHFHALLKLLERVDEKAHFIIHTIQLPWKARALLSITEKDFCQLFARMRIRYTTTDMVLQQTLLK